MQICDQYQGIISSALAKNIAKGDINSALLEIQKWMESGAFVYSNLNNYINSQMTFSLTEGLVISKNNFSNTLATNEGVCGNLASKLKQLIAKVFPWLYSIIVEKRPWSELGGNHYYLMVSADPIYFAG